MIIAKKKKKSPSVSCTHAEPPEEYFSNPHPQDDAQEKVDVERPVRKKLSQRAAQCNREHPLDVHHCEHQRVVHSRLQRLKSASHDVYPPDEGRRPSLH